MPPNDPAPSADGLSRRELLRRGGATSLAVGTIATSGCTERLPVLGRDGSGTVAVPPADSPDYGRWLPAPSALSDDLDLDPGHVIHAIPAETERGDLGGLFGFPEMMITSRADWFGHGYSHYDRALVVDRAIVLEGEIDRSVVESAASETAYEPAGTYEDYDLYGRSDVRRTVAVGDDAIVFSSDENSERNVIAVIDAADGRIGRYHETDEDFERVLDASGRRPFNWFTPTDTAVVEAVSTSYDAESFYHVHHRLYPDESSLSEAELEREFESTEGRLDPQSFDVYSDGRLATVVQQFDRETYLDTGSEYDWPQVTWGVDHDENAEQVTIRHEAGESIDAELLTVHYRPGADGTAETQFADEYETVEPGDGLALELSARRDVRQVQVSYTPGEDATSLLIDYRLD